MRQKILLKGPLLTRSGYGEQTRFALRSLRSREDVFDIFIQPLQWGQTSWINIDDDERRWIDETIKKTIGHIQSGGSFDISLQVTIPNEWEPIAPVNIGFTAGIETTKVSPEWLQKGNVMDKIIVVSNHSKNVYEDTNYTATNEATGQQVQLVLTTPTHTVNYPAKTFENLPEIELKLDYDFNFLSVAQWGPRKNLANTVKWLVEEFKDEEVGLVVKTNIAKNCFMDREKIFHEMKGFMEQFNKQHTCKVYLLHGDMTDEEMHSLYTNSKIKSLIAIPHGEGFGLPIFEAAYSGLPVIATGWSGQLDFLVDGNGKDWFYNVAFDIQLIPPAVEWAGVLLKESMWAYPREQSAKEQMRKCYDDIQSGAKNTGQDLADKLALRLHDEFSPEKKYEEFCDVIIEKDALEIENWLMGLQDGDEDEIVEYE